jgi:hypothetical protein
MKEIDDFFAEHARKNMEGTLTVGETIFGYCRLLEGIHAGKVIIKTCARIDDKPIIFFANGLTWAYVDSLKDIRCECVGVTFSKGTHSIDRRHATWYNDNPGGPPQYFDW